MGWTEPVSAITGIGGMLFGFLQWRDARAAKEENKGMNERLQKIATHTSTLSLLPNLVELAGELKRLSSGFPEDKSLNEKLALIEQELKNFQEALKYNQDAADWLVNKNRRLHLAKDAGDEALKICALKLPDRQRKNFYKDIYKYLTWLFFTLYYGVPVPIEIISRTLPDIAAYQEAFNFIMKKIPKNLSVDADNRIRSLILNLINDIGSV